MNDWSANHLTGFYMRATLALNGLTLKKPFSATNGAPSEFDNHISIKMIHQKYLEVIL